VLVLAWLGLSVGRHPELLAGSLHRFFALVLAMAGIFGGAVLRVRGRAAARR